MRPGRDGAFGGRGATNITLGFRGLGFGVWGLRLRV